MPSAVRATAASSSASSCSSGAGARRTGRRRPASTASSASATLVVQTSASTASGRAKPRSSSRSTCARSGAYSPSTSSTTTGLACMPSERDTHTSMSSSRVPSPPGRVRNASERESMSPLRVRMSSTTSSSSAARSPTSFSSSASGITPVVCAPPARAAFATAPIIDRSPPPETSEWPRRASSRPTCVATSTYEDAIEVLEAQKTQMAAISPRRRRRAPGRSPAGRARCAPARPSR